MTSIATANSAPHPFACPDCRLPLSAGPSLRCGRCHGQYQAPSGVVSFNDLGLYHGPILPRDQMRHLLALTRSKGYDHVISNYLPTHEPEFSRYISAPARTRGLEMLDLRGGERVLDYGCAFGLFSFELVNRAALVVALDVTREKLEFLEIVKQQRGLGRLFPVCNGNPLRLPFVDGFFDWVILNAVFEYLPHSIHVSDVWEAHLRALTEIHRVLRPGGGVYLATKNRYSYRLLAGGRDHNGLRFTSLLPRRLANWITLKTTGRPYRTITHSYAQYKRLLSAAGFRRAAFYWPFPSLQYPQTFLSIGQSKAELLAQISEIKSPTSLKGYFWRTMARLDALPRLIPQYIIVAHK